MAHGLNAMLKRGPNTLGCNNKTDGKTGIGSRRIFAPQFKLQVLDSYRNDADCKGNQRATARKYGIHRRQIQKWLQVENNLRNSVIKSGHSNNNNTNNTSSDKSSITTTVAPVASTSELIACPEAETRKCGLELALRSGEQSSRQRDDVFSAAEVYLQQHKQRHIGVTEMEHERTSNSGSVGTCGGEAGSVVVQQQQQGDRAASAMADKRVPDTPHNISITSSCGTGLYHPMQSSYEWHHHQQQMRSSPDTSSSTTSSCCSITSDRGDVSPQHHSLPTIMPYDGKCECISSTPSLLLPLDFTTHTRRSASPLGGAIITHTPPAAHSPPQHPHSQQHLLLSSISVLSPVPLPTNGSYTTAPSIVPMDLSLKKQQYPRIIDPTTTTPVTVPTVSAVVDLPPAPNSTTPSPRTIPQALVAPSPTQIWDLSTKGVKRPRERDSDSCGTSSPNSLIHEQQNSTVRPVKLFKPYLDHVSDDEECDIKPLPSHHHLTPPQQQQQQPSSIIAPPSAVISSSTDHHNGYAVDSDYFYNNNNNNGDFKMDYTLSYKDENSLFDSRSSVYCPISGSEYYPNGGLHYISATHYTADDIIQSPFVFSKHNVNSIKQRQSYSLDFKLNAIECYYSDAVCRGNQRAVASKFKIHRRQVQKWLKQEDQLRQRNETMKPMHIVR